MTLGFDVLDGGHEPGLESVETLCETRLIRGGGFHSAANFWVDVDRERSSKRVDLDLELAPGHGYGEPGVKKQTMEVGSGTNSDRGGLIK